MLIYLLTQRYSFKATSDTENSILTKKKNNNDNKDRGREKITEKQIERSMVLMIKNRT